MTEVIIVFACFLPVVIYAYIHHLLMKSERKSALHIASEVYAKRGRKVDFNVS
jgi:hypothetical protein